MLAAPIALVWACLGQAPTIPVPATLAVNSVAATRFAETSSPTPEPSTARQAALRSTLERRRAYLRKMRGNALRQRALIAPSWSAALARSHDMATTFAPCSDN